MRVLKNKNSPLESIWTTPCRPVQVSEMEQILTKIKQDKCSINKQTNKYIFGTDTGIKCKNELLTSALTSLC